MSGPLFLSNDATPASVYAGTGNALVNADRRLWYPFNPQSFELPSATSLGIGNTPPTLTYGPGVQNIDLGIQKEITFGSAEHPLVVSFKAEAYNLFNHFNPGNPATGLSINCNAVNGNCSGATSLRDYTGTTFGTITSAQVQARHGALTVRFRF
jgi:hypothetical protein